MILQDEQTVKPFQLLPYVMLRKILATGSKMGASISETKDSGNICLPAVMYGSMWVKTQVSSSNNSGLTLPSLDGQVRLLQGGHGTDVSCVNSDRGTLGIQPVRDTVREHCLT